MKNYRNRLQGNFYSILFCFGLGLLTGNFRAFAGDNAELISVSVPAGSQVMPRTTFTQTWTFQNTGTTTWSAGNNYTLNLQTNAPNTNTLDSLGAIPLWANTSSSHHHPSAILDSGQSVAPGATGTYSMTFIAPEATGSYTDIFQMNNSSSVFFGPKVSVQITVLQAGSTNQYDRSRAVSYANNYSAYVDSDGYFWTNGDYPDFGFYPQFTPAPPSGLGDDCAHFVSCCIGSEPHMRGGGLPIPGRTPPTYGEPSAARIVNTVLINPGYATEVSSLSQMEPGDIVAWNWGTNHVADGNIADLDHVTLYLGNGLLASHSASDLDVSANTWYQGSEPHYTRHLIHIFDAPTINTFTVGKNLVLSWTTNWSSYALYSSTSLGAGATWTKVLKSPVKKGNLNMLTNTITSGATFYRLGM